MKLLLIIAATLLLSSTLVNSLYSQSKGNISYSDKSVENLEKVLYSSIPNHKELVIKTLQFAFDEGFIDTTGIVYQKIQERLEAGAYSEDFESIPGLIGQHFPNPWDMGPSYNFNNLYPFSKIPYGSYLDSLSGWKRGLYHGYDPVQGFTWPGTDKTTVIWANSKVNDFIWDNAITFYQNGQKEQAYECLGHLLHLLQDLSIPAHVKVINHGIGISSIKSGTIIDPDVLQLIVDEYEFSLAGGISLNNVVELIPNLLDSFRSSLELASGSNIPNLKNWSDYFVDLATYTYDQQLVQKYYIAPLQNGSWGSVKNEKGDIVVPIQYGITLPAQIAGRWAQISVKTTASISGSIIPSSDMIKICNDLVPKSVEYGAGLLKIFFSMVTNIEKVKSIPLKFILQQNYPNPFNPSTTIKFQIAKAGVVSLKVYDILSKEVATLVNEDKSAGSYEIKWNAENLPSGVYFYQLSTGGFKQIKKMILLK